MSNRLYGRTSAELREQCLDWFFRPLCRELYRQDSSLQSVLFLVAQYWDDNAADATHYKIWPSLNVDPQWPEESASDPYADLPEKFWATLNKVQTELFGDDYVWLDDNASLIVAFSSFCREGGDQNREYAENYTPYAVARRVPRARGDDAPESVLDVEIRTVGTMLKPWAEDDFNVGYWDADRDPRTEPLPATEEPRVPGLPSLSIEALLRALEERARFRSEVERFQTLAAPLLEGAPSRENLAALQALRAAVDDA